MKAKYAGKCGKCRARFPAGTEIDFDRATRATSHAGECPKHPDDRSIAIRGTGKVRPAGWSPCGYPGCSPAYCDDCDGQGARGKNLLEE